MYVQQGFNETSNRTAAPTMVVSYIATTMAPLLKSNVTKICDSEHKNKPTSSHDALLYIVVVLLFYAFSMVILMVKYVRREKEEAEMAHYYSEFVARDRFKSPKFQVKQFMKNIADKWKEKESSDDSSSEDFVSCLNIDAADDRFEIGHETKI